MPASECNAEADQRWPAAHTKLSTTAALAKSLADSDATALLILARLEYDFGRRLSVLAAEVPAALVVPRTASSWYNSSVIYKAYGPEQ